MYSCPQILMGLRRCCHPDTLLRKRILQLSLLPWVRLHFTGCSLWLDRTELTCIVYTAIWSLMLPCLCCNQLIRKSTGLQSLLDKENSILLVLARANVRFLGYISITCLPVEDANARGIAMGWYLGGHLNSKINGVRPGLSQIVSRSNSGRKN